MGFVKAGEGTGGTLPVRTDMIICSPASCAVLVTRKVLTGGQTSRILMA